MFYSSWLLWHIGSPLDNTVNVCDMQLDLQTRSLEAQRMSSQSSISYCKIWPKWTTEFKKGATEWESRWSVVFGFLLGMSIRLVALDINCDFARTTICELTPWKRRPKVIDKAKRAEFKELFASCPKYGLNESYFQTDEQNGSLFDCDCEKITMYFSSK